MDERIMSTTRNSFVTVALTLMWIILAPAMFLLFTKVLGWPLDLALVILTPILTIWIPASYLTVPPNFGPVITRTVPGC